MTFRRLRARLTARFSRRRADADFDDELESHLALHIDDNLRAGMSPDDARRLALAKLGAANAVREAHRDARPLMWLNALVRDVRHGVRLMRRQPLFTTVAVLSLALGIGANTAIFSLLDHVMLRSLPLHEPARLAVIGRGEQPSMGWTYPAWTYLRTYEPLTGSIAALSSDTPRTVSVDGRTMRSRVQMVSGSFYEVLGVPAARGRTLSRRDDQIESAAEAAVAVISDRYWRARFNAAPDVVGQSVTIDLVAFTIVGVMPAGFDGVTVGGSFDLAIPLAAEHLLGGEQSRLNAQRSWWLQALVRVPPGQSVEGAAAALRGVQSQIREATLPEGTVLGQHLVEPFTLTPIPNGLSGVRGVYGMQLLLLMGAVGLVLLIACANLAGLLLARASARRHEMGLRLSLGASRARLVGQMFAESLVLATAGAALGLLVARWTGRLLVSQIQPLDGSVVLDLPTDWRMLAFTVGVTLLTTVLFGLGPALHATRSDPGETLKAQTRTLARQPHTYPALGLLFVQVALSFVLAIGAGLFLRTLNGLIDNVRGVDIDRVLIARIYVTLGPGGVADPLLFDRLLAAAREVPGVRDAAVSMVTPMEMASAREPIAAAGGDVPPGERWTLVNNVSPGFFETYGTERLAGRDFAAADTASSAPVAIVNRAFVGRFLGGREHVVGLTVVQGTLEAPGTERTIVGVVENATYVAPQETAWPIMYVPMPQSGWGSAGTWANISVRPAGGDPNRLSRPLADAFAGVSPNVAVEMHSLDAQMRSALTRQRLMASLSSALAGLALLLAGIGLYGVMAYAVTQRRREIGVRTALGATPASVVRLVTTRVAVTLVLGLAAGALLARWTGRFVESLLFGVTPADVVTFAAATGMLLATGVTAALLPAWRAARTSPADVLREE